MKIEEVSNTSLVGSTTDQSRLGRLLSDVLQSESVFFTHSETISGAARSGRMFYQKPTGKATEHHRPMTSEDAAYQLLLLTRQGLARYIPLEKLGHSKGWEIRLAVIDGSRVAIAWAEWVKQ